MKARRAGILGATMRRLFSLLALISLLLAPWPAAGAPRRDTAEELLAAMSPEERVGQLFLVTFQGTSVEPEDPIYELIVEGHIAGVLLKAENDNFVAAPDTLPEAAALIDRLQSVAVQAAEGGGVYVPLLIAISQEGDPGPYTQLLSGLTPLPSQMALGATWDPGLAQQVGVVLGRELAALGVNLLLGPSLDVLESPPLSGTGDLGVRAFGGDPFWVGEMGKAFIAGIHQGAQGKVAVVAKHFPGQGSSDRPPQEEVATVRKSLDQLRQIDLVPFFAVTGQPPGQSPVVVDALLTSHIRYQGLQGNIRASTRPVSLDREALDLVLSLEPLPQWRQSGGVLISDSLGARSVRRFYDPLEETFRAHLVARDAFLAGNDLLILDEFQSTDDPDSLTTIRATLAFFAQKYREDPLFAQRVDESVLRVLRLKLRLFGDPFLPERVTAPRDLSRVGAAQDLTFQVARNAATLLSPAPTELESRLGDPPRFGERLVFFTDVRLVHQCSRCDPQPVIDLRAMENTVATLYGPRAAGQVGDWNLASYTLADLAAYLGEPLPAAPPVPLTPPEDLDPAIQAADWLVFLTFRARPEVYGSNALQLLLDRRPDIARNKRLVVFAFDVPYDLDATEVSNLDAYYGLYSKAPPFLEVAARLLFQELPAPGAPPVSVPGIGYDLITATSPDPNQVIRLHVRPEGEGQGAEGEITPVPEPIGFTRGDRVVLETGVVVDRNGHPVPDGTPVEFLLAYAGEVAPVEIEVTTEGGVARTALVLDRIGLLTIRAQSGSARTSEILQLDVQEGVEAFVTVIAPTPVPTQTLAPTPTPLALTPTAVVEPTPTPEPAEARGAGLGLTGLVFGLMGVMLAGVGSYLLPWAGKGVSRLRVRRLWVTVVAGLLAYNYVALGFPGAEGWLASFGLAAGLLAAMVGGLLGLLGLWLVGWWEERRSAQ